MVVLSTFNDQTPHHKLLTSIKKELKYIVDKVAAVQFVGVDDTTKLLKEEEGPRNLRIMKRWNNQEHGYNDIKTSKSKGFKNQI